MAINVPPGGVSEHPYRPGGGQPARPKSPTPTWGGAQQAWPWGGPPNGSQSEPPDGSGRGKRRATIAIALTAAITTLIGGGAVAFYRMDPFHVFRPGPQPAEAVPASALSYISVDLDPMAQQKINAMRFLEAFPGFTANAGSPKPTEDLRRVFFDWSMDSLHCQTFDYDRDVAPWIGDRMAVAVMPSTATDKAPTAVVLQVSDQAAARRSVATLAHCGDSSPADGRYGMAFSHGFMIVTDRPAEAPAFARAADKESLAEQADFQADMSSLGDPGVVSAWADVSGLIGSLAPSIAASNPTFRGVMANSQRLAATFRFHSNAVEIESSMYGANHAVAHGYNPVIRLPSSTAFAFSESGGDQRVAGAWDDVMTQLRHQDPQIDRQLNLVQQQTGLRLPDDLQTVLGQNLMLAVDGRGLDLGSLLAKGPSSSTNLGMRFTNDPAKLNNLYRRIMTLAGRGSHLALPGLAKKSFSDGVTLASNPRYATTLGTLTGDLGDSDTFRSVCPDASSAETVMYLNLDAIKPQLLGLLRKAGAPADVVANVRPLQALGITSDVEGQYAHTMIRMSIDS